MNVLYLATTQYFPWIHAGFTHVYNITKNMQRLGHEVHVVCRCVKKDQIGKTVDYDKLHLHYVNWIIDDRLPFFMPTIGRVFIKSISRIKKWVKEYDIDILHERFEVPGGISCINKEINGLPNVLEVNNPRIEERFVEKTLNNQIMRINRKMQLDLSSMIVTQTEILKRIVSPLTSTPIKVIPNGADPNIFRPDVVASDIVEKYRIGNRKVVTFVGSLRAWHGLDDLIKAFQFVKNEISNSKLLIVGGCERGNEKGKVVSEKFSMCKDIVFTGPVDYKDVPKYLASSDVLVAPFNTRTDRKRREAFRRYGMWWCPIKIFEYMAMAKPVVASNVGEVPEYIKAAGLVYEEGNIQELAEKIVTLLKNEELSVMLGKEGRKKIMNEYNWKNIAEQVIDVYKRITR